MRNCQTVFQSACIFFCPPAICKSFSCSTYSQVLSIISIFKKSYFSHSNRFGVAFYILNLHFSIGYYVEHLFHMHICHTCIFKEVSVLLSSFLNCFFVYCWFFREFFISISIYLLVRYLIWKYFLLVCSLSLQSLNNVFCRARVFSFNEVQLIIF